MDIRELPHADVAVTESVCHAALPVLQDCAVDAPKLVVPRVAAGEGEGERQGRLDSERLLYRDCA